MLICGVDIGMCRYFPQDTLGTRGLMGRLKRFFNYLSEVIDMNNFLKPISVLLRMNNLVFLEKLGNLLDNIRLSFFA